MYRIAILFSCFFYLSCNLWQNDKAKNVITDTTINPATSFNNLFFDSLVLIDFIHKHEHLKNFNDQFVAFYRQRNYQYAWFDEKGLAEQAFNFMNLQTNSANELWDSSFINPDLQKHFDLFKNKLYQPTAASEILATELLLTGQFFKYASVVYKGSDMDVTKLAWFIPRKKVDLSAVLDSLIQNKGKSTERYEPLNKQYRLLEQYMVKYSQIEKNNQWQPVNFIKNKYAVGDSLPLLQQVKHKLFLTGDMPSHDSSALFDSTLFFAVKKFQNRYGLPATGVIGTGTQKEMNIPIQQKIKQLLINMERARWLPQIDESKDFITVNIPEYRLHVFEKGQYQFPMDVVVGKATDSTVIFSGNLSYIVFSPTWNVPPGILKKEVLPGMAADTGYLRKKNLTITGYTKSKEPIVVQKPGVLNPLGGVKFMFPNSFNIYLHDSPEKDKFKASSRSFSHGCIRLAEPAKMAQFLLRTDSLWTMDSIKKSMTAYKERTIGLKTKTPVMIVYLTAWVDKDGLLQFRKDIYNHDKRMAEKLFLPTPKK